MSKKYKYYKNVLISMAILFLIALIFAFAYRVYRSSSYENAKEMIVHGDYNEAKSRFEKLGDYRDCASYLELLSAIDSIAQDKYDDAITTLENLYDFEPAQEWLFEARYKYAQYLYYGGNFLQSMDILTQLWNETESEDKKNLEEWLNKSKFAYAQQLYAAKDYSSAVSLFSELDGYGDLGDWLDKSKYAYGKQLYSQMDYSSAINLFEEINGFDDSEKWLDKSKYALALELKDQNDVLAALNYFLDLGNYEKSAQYVEEILDSGIEVDSEVLYKAACRHYDAELYWRALSEFKSLGGYSDSEKYVNEIIKRLRQRLSTTVSVGQRYTVAVDREGKAITTGFDLNGQSNVNNDRWTGLVSISGFSDVTAGLKADGTVITTSRNLNNEIERNDSPWQNADIIAISVGNAYIVGLDSDGTLKSAGHDAGDGQREVDDWTDIIAIATGWRHTVGLNSTGNVLITGYGSSRQFNQMQLDKENWSNIIAIAAGGGDDIGNGHTVGLREDGKVVAAGDNEFNQCEVDQWKDIVAIAAGGGSAIGLYRNGEVIAAGYGQYRQKEIANNWSNIMVYN